MLRSTHKYWRGAESHATFVVPTKIFENVIHHIGEQSIKKKKTVKDKKTGLSRTSDSQKHEIKSPAEDVART
jgi:hypothetical protein